jgi:hypothetical protein
MHYIYIKYIIYRVLQNSFTIRWTFSYETKLTKVDTIAHERLQRWSITLRITGFVDFVHRPEF